MLSVRRIALLSEHASPTALLGGVDAGGQNVYVDELSRKLGDLGYEVDVFTRRDDPELSPVLAWAPGVRIINLQAGPPKWIFKDELWPYMPEFLKSTLTFMRTQPPYDLLHGNFWMSGWVAAQLKHRLEIPAVHIFHALGKTKKRHQGGADTSPGERLKIELDVVREVDALIAQCPSEESELVNDYGADPEKISVIPSAVNTSEFRPMERDAARKAIGLDGDDFTIVYVGRMLPRKDVRNIVRAVAILKERDGCDVRLLLVGGESADPDPATTPEIAQLRALANDLAVTDRIMFAGKRQPNLLSYYYSAGDVVVTTPWYEPFGLTPLEAMACGRPVVGSAVGGISYTVKDGQTGFLVPPRDPHALADRLLGLVRNPSLGLELGRAAREHVKSHFTWEMVAEKTATLYESTINHRAWILESQMRGRVGRSVGTASRGSVDD